MSSVERMLETLTSVVDLSENELEALIYDHDQIFELAIQTIHSLNNQIEKAYNLGFRMGLKNCHEQEKDT